MRRALSAIRISRVSGLLLFVAWMAHTAVPVLASGIQAIAGAQSEDKGRQALAFLPNELWVHVGDSVTWAFPTDEPHTVTFLGASQVRPPFPVGCPPGPPPGATPSGSDRKSTRLNSSH